jgi:enoyl-CoA hydratase
MGYENLLVEITDKIATITINRPKALNALNTAVLNELGQAFEELGTKEDVWGIILTGSGEKAFVAGADIKEMEPLDEPGAKAFAQKGQQLFTKIERFHKPIVAAVNGFALGGGCELAMACHFRVASSNAKFGQPEVALGLIPGFGGTQRLPRLVGKGAAMRLILTGEQIDAKTAEYIGLVEQVVDLGDLLNATGKMMGQIVSKGPVAVRMSIDAINRGLDGSMQQGMDIEAELFGKIFNTTDKEEGLKAFIEKRKANFTGK